MTLEKELGTNDKLCDVRACLSCDRENCTGSCIRMPDYKAKKKYNAKGKSDRKAECPSETVLSLVHWIKSGATDAFVMRELGLTKKEFCENRKAAVKFGLLSP